jgi:hypothetical protein
MLLRVSLIPSNRECESGGMEDLPSNVRLDTLRFGRIGYDPIRYTHATKVLEQQVTKALQRSHSAVLRVQS